MKRFERAAAAALLAFAAGCSGAATVPTASPAQANTSDQTTESRRPSPAPSATPSPLPTAAPRQAPVLAGCHIFPADNPWNTDISGYPVDVNSGAYLSAMNAATKHLHPDFGSDPTYGIPYLVVGAGQPRVPVNFEYANESDPGPYPVPPHAPIEGGASSTGDRHALVLDSSSCTLYEMYAAYPQSDGSWRAGSGAKFDLASNALRPDYWTSADAAGLPILPGLARYDEVRAGAIDHALRFTVHATQRAFIHPATHYASSSTNPSLPPMGLRVRLKASYDITHFSGAAHVVLTALKRYGMIVADNGSDWFISGATDSRWNDNDLDALKTVPANAFEVVRTSPIVH